MMCDGADLDEVRFHILGLIQRVGWAVVPVLGKRPSTSWAYTIGLVERGHPEIVTVGHAAEAAGRLLNSLGRMVSEGQQFGEEGQATNMMNADYRFVPVAPDHFERHGTFALWTNYYSALGPPNPLRRALELVREGQSSRIHLIR